MQKLVITLLGLATLVLAVVCAAQWRQLRSTHERLRAAEAIQNTEATAREAQSVKLAELERANTRLERQVGEFTAVTTTLRTKDATQSSNLTALSSQLRTGANAEAGAEIKPGFGKEMGAMVQKMMKDPAMREMMRSQQGSAIKMMYGGLLKQLNLTPEEKNKFMGILTDLQLKTIENAQGLFGNDPNAPDATEKNQAIADLKKQADAEIQELLGDERNQQFKDYQAHIGERMQIDQLQARLQGENVPLQDQQAAQLLETMKLEKAFVPPPISTDANENPANLRNQLTSDAIDKQIEWMNDYNRRVIERAAGFLTPEQLKSYREMQEQQAAMQQMGLKMAKEMFGGSKGGTPAPAK